MKQLYLLAMFCCLSIGAYAQIPIAYWSFEDATHAAQSLAVTDQITGANGTSASSISGAGGIGTTSTAGAGAALHAGAAGLGIVSNTGFPIANPGTGAAIYWQFSYTNTATSGFLTMTFDAIASGANLRYEVLASSNGGATFTALTTFGGTALLTTSWNTYTVTNIPAGTNMIRIYGWNASAVTMSIDNVMVLASASAASGSTAFTTADEAHIYNMVTSGSTGQFSRVSFAVGSGCNTTINNTSATSGVSIAAGGGNAFNVLTGGIVTLGDVGIISGGGGFSISSGGTLYTANAAGITAVGTPAGSIQTTNYRTFTQFSNYVFDGVVPQVTGTGLPTLIQPGAYVTIDNPAGVTLSQNTSFSGGGSPGSTLNLEDGTFIITAANLAMQTGSNVNCDNGTLSTVPTVYSNLILTYMNLGVNNLAFTTGNEWPNPFTGTVIVNKPLATISLNGNKVNTGSITISAGTLDATASNYNISLTGTWTNNASTTAFTARAATVTMNGGAPQVCGGSATTTFNNFVLNSPSYLTLGNTENVFGTLTLTSGVMVIGANNLVLGTTTPAVVGSPSFGVTNMICASSTGHVQKLMTTTGSFMFPIGDTATGGPDYTPITLNFTAGTYAGGAYAGVNVKNVKHPNNANLTNYLKRYWNVAGAGITSASYNVSATYVLLDIVGTEASIATGQYIGALPWIRYGLTNTATHTLSATAATTINSDFTGINSASPVVTSSADVAICNGTSTTLSVTSSAGDPTLSYTWAPSTGLSATTGTSVTAAPTVTTTYTVTITDGNGLTGTATTQVSVTSLPSTITGTPVVCVGLSTTLNSTPAGGAWSSSNSNATVNPVLGIVTGVTAGTSTITYGFGASCFTTTPVTVNPTPAAINGTPTVCVGLTTSLSDTDPGGTWSAGNADATVGSSSGIVTGAVAGISVITYTISNGCVSTLAVTVNGNPSSISGTAYVCIGSTTTLNSTPAGGTWASNNANVTIGSGSGIVTGVITGTSVITYTLPTGCVVTTIVTVTPNPTTITGNLNVCLGFTTTLNSTPAGGTWSTSNGNTSVGASTGIVAGLLLGTSTITYTVGTGCIITTTVTVNGNPTSITGTSMSACAGLTATLNSTPAGGTWSSSSGAIATIGSSTGIVTGIVGGTVVITYTINPGGCTSTAVFTVNAVPGPITGTNTVCIGLTTALTDAGGGTWVSSSGNVSVDGSGNVTGLVQGTTNITYTLPDGCTTTLIVTVEPNPTAITGTNVICAGATTTLNSTPAGGTWSSSNGNASVGSSTGVVTGVAAGTATITYSFGTGCYAVIPVTVNAGPTAITGTQRVCLGLTTTLNSTPAGGTWTSSNGNATVGSSTGVVTGAIVGTSVITYAFASGCSATAIVTVNSNPTAITGTLNVCVGLTTTLNSTPVGGTWASSNGNATVNALTGVVTGAIAGTSTITYTISAGCTITAVVTVNSNPTAPTGTASVCVGLTTTLNSTPAGGTWSSSNGNASVGSSTGVVTGAVAGTSVITYAISTGCISTVVVTVNPNPTTITGGPTVCLGSATTLSSSPAGGTWSSSNANVTIGSSTGIITGSVLGTSIITYTLSTGCLTTTIVTVNSNPSIITGTGTVCVGMTTTLNSTPASGTWSSSNANATVGSSTGIVTGVVAGTSVITYAVNTGCFITTIVTINPLPTAITGSSNVCVGLTTTLNGTPAGGTWSSSNGNATVGSSTGVVTGVVAGTSVITYTLNTGCYITSIMTVNANPTTITGFPIVCIGLTTTLNSTPAGGTWTSSNSNATIGSSNGVVTGVTAGTANITYTLGCSISTTVTVNSNPTPISGNFNICVGSVVTLNSTPAGGVWSSSNGNASIDPAGIVTGMAAGTSVITYALGSGCISTAVMTVNANPTTITGTMAVCAGFTTTLNSTPAGGVWSSSNSNANVGASTGIVTGLNAGTSVITYTTGTSCIITAVVTVNPAPSAITGTHTMCIGTTASLTDVGGGTWSSSNGNASVGTNGIVTGIAAGTAVITYAMPTGCVAITTVTVYPLPVAISGTLTVCAGLTTALTDATGGGTWSSSSGAIATISPAGVVTGGAVAVTSTATITYTIGTGCIITAVVTVNPLPAAITGTTSVCRGLTTTLTDITAGGTWASSNGNATISAGGVVSGITPGTSIITYTLLTGCTATTIVTVNPLPGAILGTRTVCSGSTTSLSDASGGGTWSSSTTAVATIDAVGIVTGGSVASASTSTITYTAGFGCYITADVTVNPLPSAILGNMSVCIGLTTSLLEFTSGGTWSSSASGIAGVDAAGVVTGASVGVATISYILSSTGCFVTTDITVNPLPSPISGTLTVCAGMTTTLSDVDAGGTWSASGFASVGVSSGVVTGGIVGTVSTATITYTLPTTCVITTIVTINPLPTAISGTQEFCAGASSTLTDATPGGGWTSSDIYIATVGFSTGTVTGVSGGTVSISYTLSTGCYITTIVTVDPLPGAILGNLAICAGLTSALSDLTASGTWSIAPPGVATISGAGVVTATIAGTTIVTYTLPTGCSSTAVVTVNPLPSNITGTMSVCAGLTTSVTDATAGGVWSSSNSTIADIGSATGVITGVSAGTAIITYTLSTGCIKTAIATVNPLPSPIGGSLAVCEGLTTSLADAGGGTWSMTNAHATISSSGIVAGVSNGLDTVIYTLPTGCIATAVVTVYAFPSAITGNFTVCAGLTTALSDSPVGGTWSSSNAGVATVGSSTGIVTGGAVLTAGTTTITYNLAAGCNVTATVTVNPLPTAILGSTIVCIGYTTTLSDAAGGGTWSSSNASVGSVVAATGDVMGVSAGTVVITYTLPTGCIATTIVTVTAPPAAITGPSALCFGSVITLSDATFGGTWSSSATGVATVGTDGTITTVGSGTATISYTLTVGCSAVDTITVNPVPAPYNVTGGGSYCQGGIGVHVGLSGSNVGISYLLYYDTSISATGYLAGTGSALDFGLLTVGGVYTVLATNNTTGCTSAMTGSVTVTIIPTINPTVSISTAFGDTVCPGTLVTFRPYPDSGGTFQWSVNGVLVSLDTVYTFIPADSDVITVNMTSNAACIYPLTATDTFVIHVIPGGVPMVNIMIDPGDTVCEFAMATFTATPTFGGPSPQYKWYVNNTLQSATGNIFSYLPATGDIVSCKMISDYLCRSTDTAYSNTAVMTVDPLLIPHVDVVSSLGFDIMVGTYDTLHAIVSNAGLHPTYQWEVNGLLITGATNDTYVSQFNNYDSVTCVVTSTGFCDGISTFDWIYITVHPVGVPQYTAGSGDIRLMPNPNTGVFTIRGTLATITDEDVFIDVTDMAGQVVYRNKVKTQAGRINEQIKLNNVLPNGMYLLNLRSESENKVFHFVIVQ